MVNIIVLPLVGILGCFVGWVSVKNGGLKAAEFAPF